MNRLPARALTANTRIGHYHSARPEPRRLTARQARRVRHKANRAGEPIPATAARRRGRTPSVREVMDLLRGLTPYGGAA